MIKTFVISVAVFTSVNLAAKRFENTNWVSKAAHKYVASINLRSNSYAVRYSKNTAQTFRGCYSVSNDTLIIKERDDSKQIPVYQRIKFILKDRELHFYSMEAMVNHQWIKSKSGLNRHAVFTRI